jgi:mannose-6-phosphate isomerase-like protein (cupin superfamily)
MFAVPKMSDSDQRFNDADVSRRTEDVPTLTLFNGNNVRVLTPGQSTDQRLTVIEYVDFTLGNPPPFTRHDFIEVFSVLEGRLAFQYLDETPFYVSAGNAATVPSGFSHTFWNPDDQPLRIMLVCTPAGLDGFFEAIHREAEKFRADQIGQDEVSSIMAKLRIEYGVEETAAAPDID